MYSSNITPDPVNGIGKWTEEQFEGALRRGKGSHGEFLYPAMPYTAFTKISDSDLHALWVYFRTIPPIAEKTKKNEMKFPFNVRPGIGAWQALFFKQGRYVADTSQTVDWNRGAYLVQGLGHCGACHTPKNFLMADRKGLALKGAETGDFWFAPDISGGRFSGIADWSEAQIVTYLKTGHNDKNVAAVGPMLSTIAQGTAELATSDLQSIAVYLKSQNGPKELAQPKEVAFPAERRAAGAQVYAEHCASCHGDDGKGVNGIAPALAGNSAATAPNADNIVHSVLEGFEANPRWGAMPSFARVLDGQDIADVANHVRTAWQNNGTPNATAYAVNRMRQEVDTGVDTKIQSALVCPTVPAGAIDAKTDAELAALAARPQSTADRNAAATLFRAYVSRNPGTETTQAITQLSGGYCRKVMATGAGTTAERQAKVIGFTAAVSTQSVRR